LAADLPGDLAPPLALGLTAGWLCGAVSGTSSPIRGRGAAGAVEEAGAVAGTVEDAGALADAGTVEDAGAVADAGAEGSPGVDWALVTEAPSIPRKQLMSATLGADSMGLCLFIK